MEVTLEQYTVRMITMADLEDYYQMIVNNRKRLEDLFVRTVAATYTLEETAVHLTDLIRKAEMNSYFPFVVVDNQAG